MFLRHALPSGFLAVGLLIGCSGGAKREVVPPLEPVTGKVTIDGQPAERVNVSFYPAPNNKSNAAFGSTDASGAYTLKYKTGAGSSGIAAGDYVVLFSKLTQPDGSPIPADKTAADVNAIDQIHERYRTTDNPQNTVSVPKGGKTFDFDLKSK
ncbi:MAG: hypothetical protein AABP62_23460 [Planctomycetota bacterium]